MRILAAGDFHGILDSLIRAVERFSPDLLLSPGDWGDPGQVNPSAWQSLLRTLHVLTITGNHDDVGQIGNLANTDGSPILIGQGEVRKAQGLRVGGVSGIWAKTRLGSRLNARWQTALARQPDLTIEQFMVGRPLPPYVTDDEVAAFAAEIAASGADILITHGCPVGLSDLTPSGGHHGQRCFRAAFERVKPRVHLCGHLHRLQRSDHAGSLVLNSGDGARGDGWILDLRDGGWEARELSSAEEPG